MLAGLDLGRREGLRTIEGGRSEVVFSMSSEVLAYQFSLSGGGGGGTYVCMVRTVNGWGDCSDALLFGYF